MVDLELALDIFENTIPKDYKLDKRTTYARPPVSNIVEGAKKEDIKYPYYLKDYLIVDEGTPEARSNDPLYGFGDYLDESINAGAIDIRSGMGFMIESEKFRFNTVIFWDAIPHVPHPYAFMHIDGVWVEVEPKKEGLFCLHESRILNFENNLRRSLIGSDRGRFDWEQYLTDTVVRAIL